MNKLQWWFVVGATLFCLLYVLPVSMDHATESPDKPECPQKPHLVWGMVPQSKLDAPVCRLIKAYGRFTVILEGEDGTVFVAHGNHLTIPDETHSSLKFVDWQNYRQIEEDYDAVVTALIQPYCRGHGEAQTALPKGVMSMTGAWADYYPIVITCGDGTRITVADKLLQYTQETSHTK